MSPQQTARYLKQDPDRYVASMTDADFTARRSSGAEAYKAAAAAAALDAKPSQETLLRVARGATHADAFFSHLQYDEVDGAAIARLPWLIAFTRGDAYEDGLPHTRGECVFLSLDHLPQSERSLVATLVHEKVHLYQRANAAIMRKWLERRGYQATRLHGSAAAAAAYRSNPDMNGWHYRKCDPMGASCSKEMGAPYSSGSPRRITDVVHGTDGPNEHPFEKMAYDIEHLFLSSSPAQ